MPSQTKGVIVDSFYGLIQKKSFEKITVKDIVEDCGINRKTFYYYFRDIYDLVEFAFKTEMERYIDSIPENQTLEECVSGIFELVEKNKKTVYHINMASDGELKRYLYGALYETVFKKYKVRSEEFGISEKDFKLICEVLVMSFMGMISVWLDGGLKPEYKDDIRRVCALFNGSVEYMMGNIKNIQ